MTPADKNLDTSSAARPAWFVGVTAVLISLLVSGVLTGGSASIVDTDGFMRMSRITDLWSGEVGWWDGFAYRSNAPFGHSMHWTRPLDALVILLALPIQLVADSGSALRLGALAAGPLVLGAVAGSITWAVHPLVGRVGAVVAGLGVALQPTLLAYGSPGRVDHHGLIFLTTAVLFGFSVRLAIEPRSARASAAAGIAAALGIWVSTELLLPVALVLMAFLVAWIVSGTPSASVMRTFALWWAGGTVVALLIERAPDMLDSRDLDRISAVHLLVAGLAAAFWVLVGFASTDRWQTRALLATGAGLVTAVTLWLIVPSFVSGPFGDVPPALWDAWLSRVAELQPLWPFGANPARTVYLLTAPLIGVALAWRAGVLDQGFRAVWWGLAVLIAGLVALGVAQARFTAFSQLLATVAWGWLAAILVARVAHRRGIPGSLLRVGSMLAGVAGFLVPVILLALLAGPNAEVETLADCDLDDVVAFVNHRGGEPVVLTHIDWGPEILYRTNASVLASPYHRNVDGILDARRFMGGPPGEAALIAAERSVDLVALCEERDANYLGSDRPDGDLLSLVAEGRTPTWLIERPMESAVRLFEVDGNRLP
jgi:hypothetical protein